jgi:hypothetical protein
MHSSLKIKSLKFILARILIIPFLVQLSQSNVHLKITPQCNLNYFLSLYGFAHVFEGICSDEVFCCLLLYVQVVGGVPEEEEIWHVVFEDYATILHDDVVQVGRDFVQDRNQLLPSFAHLLEMSQFYAEENTVDSRTWQLDAT